MEPSSQQAHQQPLHNILNHLLGSTWLRKWLIWLLASSTFFVFAGSFQIASAQNSDHFRTTLATTYDVSQNGIVRVTHSFKVTNTSPLFYLSKYGLTLSSTNITNVTVASGDNQYPVTVTPSKSQTSISTEFSDRIVGQGKVRTFTITYDDPDAAVVSGKVLSVYVPQFSTSETFDAYTVTINTPPSFGPPSRTLPDYSNWETGQTVNTTFNDVRGKSVSAFFGSEQIYSFELMYHLENPTGQTGIIQIALPPDTTYQRVYYHNLDPEPLEITTDPDGNWLATYELDASFQLDVTAQLDVIVTLEPRPNTTIQPPGKAWLQSQKYWDTEQAQIVQAAAEHTTPEMIYNYVVDTLSYNYDKIGENNQRLGAAGALQNGSNAVCLEYTDLFVSMARANDIPARRATGYAYTQNETLRPLSLVEDILHAWPEYFDQETKRWKPVDPTWGDTTGGLNYFDQFDLEHVVFAYNGISSETPYAAGTYKLPNTNSKDVSMQFIDQFPKVTPDLSIEVTKQKLGGIIIPGSYQVSIKNNAGSAAYDIPVTISSQNEIISTRQLEQILPFQTVSFPLQLKSAHPLVGEDLQVQLVLHDAENTTVLKSAGSIFVWIATPARLTGVGIGLVFFTLIAGSVLVYWRGRRRALRR